MQNNSFNMKRVFITLGLLLGVLCFSCENNVKNGKENLNKQMCEYSQALSLFLLTCACTHTHTHTFSQMRVLPCIQFFIVS